MLDCVVHVAALANGTSPATISSSRPASNLSIFVRIATQLFPAFLLPQNEYLDAILLPRVFTLLAPQGYEGRQWIRFYFRNLLEANRARFSENQLSASIFSIFCGADAVIRGEVVYHS
jgi:hypothetical protein